MTGDVEESSLFQISQQLGVPVSSSTCAPTTGTDSTAYINSNMTVEDSYVCTAAIPADLAGSFPEGTVLQIMSDSSIVALAMKNLPTPNASNTVTFKDTTFTENITAHNGLIMSNILTESTENNESQTVGVPACNEDNMSDIDLSFLSDTNVIADPKCINEAAVKELQGMMAAVSSQSLSLLQNNLTLTNNSEKPSQVVEQINSELPKEAENPPGDVVMIDVTKPIQLSQNSLIMVNGQKCILQQDPQTGQVIAYPVKEQDKPRKKRGRPRKSSLEQVKETACVSTENTSLNETETISEEEREKGLLEVVNDDGSLVRRSSRRRKKAKTLRDYETGNLQQELGSDVDEVETVDQETETNIRKKKNRGPGRPRKYPKPLEITPKPIPNDGVKRPRGRPRKHVPENEPTQAFLVQTADGQTLMMQVPLSSIPPGVTLQEMAEEIANKLNYGFSLTNTASSNNESTKESETVYLEDSIKNISSESNDSVSEPAVQDHSIGSTTNFHSVQQLNPAEENSEVNDSSCQTMMNNIDPIVDSMCEVEEVALENETCIKDVTSHFQNIIAENILDNENNLNTLDVPQCSEDNFCINMPSTTSSSIDSTPILCNLADSLSNQFCVSKTNDETLKESSGVTDRTIDSKISKDIFSKNDFLKDKVDFQILLQDGGDIPVDVQTVQIEEILQSANSTNLPDRLGLNVNNLKMNVSYISEFPNNEKDSSNVQSIVHQIQSIDSSEQITENVFACESVETTVNNENSNLHCPSIVESVENDVIIQSDFLENAEISSVSDKSASTFIDADSIAQTFETSLSPPNVSSLTSSVANVQNPVITSATEMIPVTKKNLPLQNPEETIPGFKKCKICKMLYSEDEELIEHFKSRHPKCICTDCNYMADHPYVIKRHSYRHSNQEIVCKTCNKKYKDLYILKIHNKMVHLPPDVLYTCEVCKKQFTRKAHLKRHLRIHEPVKKYQCPHCDYKGCEKSDITKHLLIHDVPKFKCEICQKAFRHVKNRDLHVKRHSNQRDYKCGICEFYGYTFTDIRKHIQRRHNNASCPFCGQVFKDAELLKEHMKLGACQTALDQPCIVDDVVKVEETGDTCNENEEEIILDEMPMELLETEQQQIMTISECSEETLSALQSGHFIMASVDGILSTQNCQFVLESVEEDNIVPNNLSTLTDDKDSSKMITLVTNDGRNLAIPLKNLEYVTTAADISEKFILPNEYEAGS